MVKRAQKSTKCSLPSTTHRDWLIDILSLSLLLIIFYTLWLGHYPLFTPDEGRYSEVAREMLATGDYITPRINGVIFLDKPILHYWLQALAIHLLGLKEWVLRLVPALFGIGGCLMTYLCGRLLFGRRTGLLAAIILAATPLYFGAAHYANLDLEVAVLITGSLLCFITSVRHPPTVHRTFLFAAYIFTALAILTKGLIGVVFPIIIIATWLFFQRRLSLLKKMHLATGTVLLLTIVLPWYLLEQKVNPGFFHFFFITQQVTRFLSTTEFNNKMPFWFYVPIVMIGFFPWTIFLLQTIRHNIQLVWQQRRVQQTELFLLLWPAIIFLFFSIPQSKLIGYILPVFPPLALLTGKYLNNCWEKAKTPTPFLATGSILFLLALPLSATHFNQQSVKPLAMQLKPLLNPHDEIITFYKYYQDLPLYLERRITIVADWQSPNIPKNDNWLREFWYGITLQKTADWLINEDTFWQRFNGKKQAFVFMNTNYLDNFQSKAKHYYKIGQVNNIVLFSNKPLSLTKNP